MVIYTEGKKNKRIKTGKAKENDKSNRNPECKLTIDVEGHFQLPWIESNKVVQQDCWGTCFYINVSRKLIHTYALSEMDYVWH